jgi:hypothetical protein
VTAGATVLAIGCQSRAFLTATDSPNRGVPAEPKPYAPRFPSPLAADAPSISMRPDCAAPIFDDRYTTLYGDDREGAVRFRRTGRGLIVWWADGTPVANASIGEPGHLELLLNAAGAPGRTVLWDEFYHGQRRSLYSYARATPLPWAAAQAGLVLLVAAAIHARRRAPILDRPVPSRTSPLEFVDTMAGPYARANTAADAVAVARARLRRLLAAATGLAPDATDERLAMAVSARRRVDQQAITAALAASAAPLPDSMTAREALEVVRRLQACAAAVERTGG